MGDVMQTIMTRASVRKFEDRPVPRELIEQLAVAGQQAPFTGQMYSFVVTTDAAKRQELSTIFGPLVLRAPVFMLICVDFRKLEKFIASRGRTNLADDMSMLFLGIQDASYAAEHIVLAAEEAGLGTCYLGAAPFVADRLVPMFKLPQRVYPLVGLVLGYPGERPPARPRIPTNQALFWDEYSDLTDAQVTEAMSIMDAGLIREGYYASRNSKIKIQGDDKVGYDEYGWSEHISRKYGVHGARSTGALAHLKAQGIFACGKDE